jgi:hypothetical protein
MTIIKREIEINLTRDAVWKALADFGNICHGHPAVSKSYVSSEQKQGVGATRHCDFTMMGASAEERVVAWNEGKNIKISVYELHKMPGIQTMELDMVLRDQGSHTILTGIMDYTMKNKFFDMMDTLVMKRMNAKLLDGIMAGHKKYIETGEIVTENTILDLKQVVAL